MIVAEKLQLLSTMGPKALAQVLKVSGYTGCSFESAKFVGLTNGTEFCYSVTFYDDGSGPSDDKELSKGKVFVKFDCEKDAITADF